MERKLFTEKQINVSAFLGGPVPAGFLIYKNYVILGKEKEAYISLATTLLFTVVFFYIIIQLPQEIIDKIPNFVFTAFYGFLVALFFHKFMKSEVNSALETGVKKASNWSVAGLTLFGLVINLAIIFGFAVNQPFYDGEVIEANGNQLYYDQTIPISDVNKLVSQFKDNDFFGTDYGNIARLQMIDNEYVVTMVIDETLWTDSEIINTLTSIKWLMETNLQRKISLKLESVSLAGESKFKEL